jgi:hypothetical protein
MTKKQILEVMHTEVEGCKDWMLSQYFPCGVRDEEDEVKIIIEKKKKNTPY